MGNNRRRNHNQGFSNYNTHNNGKHGYNNRKTPKEELAAALGPFIHDPYSMTFYNKYWKERKSVLTLNKVPNAFTEEDIKQGILDLGVGMTATKVEFKRNSAGKPAVALVTLIDNATGDTMLDIQAQRRINETILLGEGNVSLRMHCAATNNNEQLELRLPDNVRLDGGMPFRPWLVTYKVYDNLDIFEQQGQVWYMETVYKMGYNHIVAHVAGGLLYLYQEGKCTRSNLYACVKEHSTDNGCSSCKPESAKGDSAKGGFHGKMFRSLQLLRNEYPKEHRICVITGLHWQPLCFDVLLSGDCYHVAKANAEGINREGACNQCHFRPKDLATQCMVNPKVKLIRDAQRLKHNHNQQYNNQHNNQYNNQYNNHGQCQNQGGFNNRNNNSNYNNNAVWYGNNACTNDYYSYNSQNTSGYACSSSTSANNEGYSYGYDNTSYYNPAMY